MRPGGRGSVCQGGRWKRGTGGADNPSSAPPDGALPLIVNRKSDLGLLRIITGSRGKRLGSDQHHLLSHSGRERKNVGKETGPPGRGGTGGPGLVTITCQFDCEKGEVDRAGGRKTLSLKYLCRGSNGCKGCEGPTSNALGTGLRGVDTRDHSRTRESLEGSTLVTRRENRKPTDVP